MIDSTNPRNLANAIRDLWKRPVGTEVKANPSGSTGDHVLTKIQIGSTKYAVGGGATTTVLYNPGTPAEISSTASDITLSGVITGFDYILLTLGNNPGRDIAIATPADLESEDGCSHPSGSSQEWEYEVDSTDHLTLSIKCGGSGRLLHKVVGIKL